MSPRQERNGRKFGETGRVIVEVLREHGVTGYRFEKSKHVRVHFEIDGLALKYQFAGSPQSDGASARRARRELTRLIAEARG